MKVIRYIRENWFSGGSLPYFTDPWSFYFQKSGFWEPIMFMILSMQPPARLSGSAIAFPEIALWGSILLGSTETLLLPMYQKWLLAEANLTCLQRHAAFWMVLRSWRAGHWPTTHFNYTLAITESSLTNWLMGKNEEDSWHFYTGCS